jgi:hypothetical protein
MQASSHTLTGGTVENHEKFHVKCCFQGYTVARKSTHLYFPSFQFTIWWVTLHQRQLLGCWYVLSPIRKETSYSDIRFWVSCILCIIIIGGILVLFIYITRVASNKIFSPSNKIHQAVGRAKDLSAPLYVHCYVWNTPSCDTILFLKCPKILMAIQ